MMTYRFRPGQIVYVQGRYRAKVVECNPNHVYLDVYEGLSPKQKSPQRAGYGRGLVEAKKRRASSAAEARQ